MKLKRILSLFLSAVVLCTLLCVPAGALDSSKSFQFALTSGMEGQTLNVGDVVTVTLTLKRTDKAEAWSMYAWQTEIAYDNTVFELVEGSVSTASGVGSSIHPGDDTDKVYFNDYSLSKSGDEYAAELVAGSFSLRVIGGASGSCTVQNTNYLVGTQGGTDSYAVSARDLTMKTEGGTTAPGNSTGTFTDVAAGIWYEDAVNYVVEHGLFNGTSATTFSPDKSMTRAMLVTVLYRLDGSPAVSAKNNFADVKDGQWYTDAVVWANQNEIVEGYGNGLFGTEDYVTREQMATILYRYSKFKNYDVNAIANLSGYSDAAKVSSWATAAMSWANAEGLITGRTNTTLVPQGTATRAEVATILMRFCENVAE